LPVVRRLQSPRREKEIAMTQRMPRKKIVFHKEVLKNLTQDQTRIVAGAMIEVNTGRTCSKPYACASSNDPTAC
jgi:hypothetical protein